jgi:hypothetical protein
VYYFVIRCILDLKTGQEIFRGSKITGGCLQGVIFRDIKGYVREEVWHESRKIEPFDEALFSLKQVEV